MPLDRRSFAKQFGELEKIYCAEFRVALRREIRVWTPYSLAIDNIFKFTSSARCEFENIVKLAQHIVKTDIYKQGFIYFNDEAVENITFQLNLLIH